MKNMLFVLGLMIVPISCQAPNGFSESGHYGTDFATRKSYFRSNTHPAVNASVHKEACESFGLSPLHFDTREEAVFFLSVMRNDFGFVTARWVGALQEIGQWIWQETNERIDYILPWATGYPITAPGNCLTLNKNGFLNSAACSSNQLYFCQSIGG